MYNEGISWSGDLLDMAVEMGVMDKRGSYYYYEDENLAQGRENVKEFLRENRDLASDIEAEVRALLNPEEDEEPDEEEEKEEASEAA
jgi:recombination protein RecA